MWLLLIQVALGASPWDSQDSSVGVSRVIAAEREAVYEQIDDLKELSALYPATCVSDWEFDDQTTGVGARGEVTYRFEKFRRRLAVTIEKAEASRYVELDHLSSKGFITRWLVEESEAGSVVSLKTYINPPPWPFKGYYFKKIKPAWTICYQQTLDNLEARVVAAAN